jgi:hypothetical protein
MTELGFRVETVHEKRVKIREDGRRGPCIADEANLWDALQDALNDLARVTADRDGLLLQLQGEDTLDAVAPRGAPPAKVKERKRA